MTHRPRIQISQSLRLELNPSLQAAIGILRTDAGGLTLYLEEQAAANPHLRLERVAPLPGDWLPRWSGAFSGSGLDPDLAAAAAPSLAAHVTAEIARLSLSPRAHRIAQALAEALEPSGWLGRPVEAVAADLQASVPETTAVLEKLQTIEPAGLFARNLSDCLRIQAREAGLLDPAMAAVLDHLPLLAQGEFGRLGRLARLTAEDVAARFRLIRRMNPKPGTLFAGPGPAVAVREPDLLARATADGGWEIALNRSSLPTVSVRRAEGGDDQALARAQALKQAVAARNATLLRVGREIAARQQAALTIGPAALMPMTMAEIGEALGLHESTISRTVAGASLDTPRGTWWLRQMFAGGRASGDEAPTLSATALRHRLLGLIGAEDAAHPLTDAALAGALERETGIRLPRRTVAHYRELAGIPPSHRRKRR